MLLSLHSFAAEEENMPVREINGKSYYEYTVKKGDGLWGLSRRFSVSQAELYTINPSLESGLKVGQTILIPVAETGTERDSLANGHNITHVVTAKQTLYGISRMYDVPVKTLIENNPSVKEGLKVGDVLVIKECEHVHGASAEAQGGQLPAEGISHQVKRKETLYSISRKYGVPIHDLIAANPEIEKGLKAGTVITIPVDKSSKADVLVKSALVNSPVKDDASAGTSADVVNPARVMSGQDTLQGKTLMGWKSPYNASMVMMNRADTLSIAILLPFMEKSPVVDESAERFIEFYKGALLALEHAKRRGITSEVYTYDIGKDARTLDSVLQLPELSAVDVIVGPAYSNQVEPVLRFAKARDVVCMVPFSSNIPSGLRYDKLLQFNPSQDELFERIITETFQNGSRQYVIGRVKGCKNKGDVFADALEEKLKEVGKEYVELYITPDNADTIAAMASRDSVMLLPASSYIEDVSAVLDTLKSKELPKLSIWGFEDWKAFLREYPNTYYYSLFKPTGDTDYLSMYTNWFGTRKETDEWQYDLIGYDIMTLIVNGIEKGDNGNVTLAIEFAPADFYLQSSMRFEKHPDGGYVNMNYHTFFFDGEQVKVLK